MILTPDPSVCKDYAQRDAQRVDTGTPVRFLMLPALAVSQTDEQRRRLGTKVWRAKITLEQNGWQRGSSPAVQQQ